MPNVPFHNLASQAKGEKALSDQVFGVEPNHHLIYEAVRHYRAKLHRGTHSTKNRAVVSGGGAKPWRQKGTGRARVGSNRTPLWRKGGTTFGPRPRDYGFKLSGKSQVGALRSALSMRAGENALVIIDDFVIDKPSTKSFLSQMKGMGLDQGKVLIVDDRPGDALCLSARNVPRVEIRSAAALQTYDVVAADHVLLSERAASQLEARLSR